MPADHSKVGKSVHESIRDASVKRESVIARQVDAFVMEEGFSGQIADELARQITAGRGDISRLERAGFDSVSADELARAITHCGPARIDDLEREAADVRRAGRA